MKCNRKAISLYIDKELDSKTAKELEGHIQSCINCRLLLKSLQSVGDLLKQKSQIQAPPEFVGALNNRLVREALSQGKDCWVVYAGNLAKRLIPVPVLAVILFFVVISRSTQVDLIDNYLSEDTEEVTISELF